jgi:hypothetical protein
MNIWTLLQRVMKPISRLAKRLRDYSFFRGLGQGIAESWEKSGRTLS